MAYWLMKSEPESYSWTDLVRDGGRRCDSRTCDGARDALDGSAERLGGRVDVERLDGRRHVQRGHVLSCRAARTRHKHENPHDRGRAAAPQQPDHLYPFPYLADGRWGRLSALEVPAGKLVRLALEPGVSKRL